MPVQKLLSPESCDRFLLQFKLPAGEKFPDFVRTDDAETPDEAVKRCKENKTRRVKEIFEVAGATPRGTIRLLAEAGFLLEDIRAQVRLSSTAGKAHALLTLAFGRTGVMSAARRAELESAAPYVAALTSTRFEKVRAVGFGTRTLAMVCLARAPKPIMLADKGKNFNPVAREWGVVEQVSVPRHRREQVAA